MSAIEHIIWAFLIGAGTASLITYYVLTLDKRAVSNVRRAIIRLGICHELTEHEYRKLNSPTIASDDRIMAVYEWATRVCQHLKKEDGIRIDRETLTAEVIICDEFYDIGSNDVVRALIKVRELLKTQKLPLKNRNIVLGRKSKGVQAEEELRAYEENYQREGNVLKRRILEELKAISRGECDQFTPEGVQAAKALQERHGDHPETLAEWAPLLNSLSSRISNAEEIHTHFDELLYPDALQREDMTALQKIVDNEREKSSKKKQIHPFGIEARKAGEALRPIKERYEKVEQNKRLKERETEIAERKREEARREDFRQASMETNRRIARINGLPEDTPPDELLWHMRSKRLVAEFERKSPEERDRIIRELESESRKAYLKNES
jgi:hypothetical protein